MVSQTNKLMVMIALLLLISCDYHLRKAVKLPADSQGILLQNASFQLKSQMQNKLQAMGESLRTTPEPNTVIISVTLENINRRVLSLSSTGRVNEYELYYQLSFNLLDAIGQPIINEQTIEINRDYFNNQQNILGKNNEEQRIRNEIYHQAIQLIFNRLAIALTNKKTK